jgi:uncharacterized protein (TIGR00251 family)
MSSPAAPPLIRETSDGVLLRIHVQPRASRTELCGWQGEELKIRVTSPPVDDAANRLCIEFFAKLLGVAKSRLAIATGSKSRHKTILISGIPAAEVLTILGENS